MQKNQPHVQVALKMISRGKSVKAGQEVPYVICQASASDDPKVSFASRAHHPHEFQLDPSLRVDVAWYKSQQVHPLVSRILAPIEGTDAARIAECLGMDGSRFARAAAKAAESGDVDMAYVESAAADVAALLDRKTKWGSFISELPGVPCIRCSNTVSWRHLLQPEVWEAHGATALFKCQACSEPVHPARAHNLAVIQLRARLKSHCEGWVRCADETNIAKTRRDKRGTNLAGERRVWDELEYLDHLCGVAGGHYDGEDQRNCRETAKGLQNHVRWLLDQNGHNWVDCGKVFGAIFGAP